MVQQVGLFCILAVLLLSFALSFMTVVMMCITKEKKAQVKMKLKIQFRKVMIRVMMEFYAPIFISLFLNIKFVTVSSVIAICSFSLACVVTTFFCSIPLYYTCLLYKNINRLDEDEFKAKYGTFYEDLKLGRPSTILFY